MSVVNNWSLAALISNVSRFSWLRADLQLPDLLALFGDLGDGLTHQCDQHVEQEHKGEDNVGDCEDEADGRVLHPLDHFFQVSQADCQLEQVQQNGAESRGVSAVGLICDVPLVVCVVGGTRIEQRHQR